MKSINLFTGSVFEDMEKVKLQISKIISELMTEQGITMKEIAKATGVSEKQIYKITSGQNYKVDSYLRVAFYLQDKERWNNDQ